MYYDLIAILYCKSLNKDAEKRILTFTKKKCWNYFLLIMMLFRTVLCLCEIIFLSTFLFPLLPELSRNIERSSCFQRYFLFRVYLWIFLFYVTLFLFLCTLKTVSFSQHYLNPFMPNSPNEIYLDFKVFFRHSLILKTDFSKCLRESCLLYV